MKATKKLIFAAVSLIAASSLTVGSTFAWFSFQSNVELKAVQFSVDSGDENLQIAVTTVGGTPAPSDFSYSLTESTIKSQINKGNVVYKQLTVSMDEDEKTNNTVSATNTINLVDKDGNSAVVSSSTAADYAEFDLVFRYTPATTSGEMPDLILNYESQITSVDPADGSYPTKEVRAWEDLTTAKYGSDLRVGVDKDATTKVEKDQLIKARASDAARVAFLFDDGGTTKNKIWAPNEEHSLFASDTSDTAKGFFKGNLASDYNLHYGNSTKAIVAPSYESRVYAGIQTPTTAANFNYSKITKFPNVGANGYSELVLTVKVWLEGNDGDCLESVCDDIFAFTLKFRTSTIKSAS